MTQEHLSQSLEDYLEALFLLSRTKAAVRVKDLVSKLAVSSPSVIGALDRLEALGLVCHEHHSHVALTPAGEDKAKNIYKRHTLLTSFFINILGVSGGTAEADACKIEHLISSETLAKLQDYMDRHGS